MSRPSINPLLILLIWLAAAYVVIGTGPMFLPATGSTVGVAALLWKLFGALLLLAASAYLLRSRPGAAILGLAPSRRTISLLVLGGLGGAVILALWLLLFWLFVPFHVAPGTITAAELIRSLLIYLCGALLEELAFRGHALIRLRARYGTAVAVALVSLAFGLLHLPGMTGVDAVKMIVTTGLCSVLFCLAYLRTGSLWTAVGLHTGMNVMLHRILGAGGGQGPSLLRPIYGQPAAAGYDLGFWSFILVLVIAIAALTRLTGSRGASPAAPSRWRRRSS